MSAKHTRGRMVVNPIQLDQIATADASKGIAHVTHFGHSVDTVIANARRLAACWNACEGISAEHLEDDAVHKLIRDRDLLLAQRDELLEAAKQMQSWCLVLLNSLDAELDSFEVELSNSKTGYSVTLSLKEHFVKARAAITKAIG